MTYTYNNVSITNLAITATRIGRLLGVMPTGLNDSGDRTEIMFASDLTAPQKALLDSFMAGSNLDSIPSTTNTVYTLADFDLVKAATGLDFDVYPTATNWVIHFTKVLTSQEKNNFRGAVANLLVIS